MSDLVVREIVLRTLLDYGIAKGYTTGEILHWETARAYASQRRTGEVYCAPRGGAGFVVRNIHMLLRYLVFRVQIVLPWTHQVCMCVLVGEALTTGITTMYRRM